MGANLNVVLKRPAVAEQLILDEGVWALNHRFFELNQKRNFYSPNLAVPVHRLIKGKRKNCSHHLHEVGLRLTAKMREKWAGEMIKATTDNKIY